jgi:hypothetical protein
MFGSLLPRYVDSRGKLCDRKDDAMLLACFEDSLVVSLKISKDLTRSTGYVTPRYHLELTNKVGLEISSEGHTGLT